MINGITYNQESIKVQFPSGPMLLAEKITYEDAKDDKIIKNKYGIPIGVARGAYSGGGSLELAYEDYTRLRDAVAAAGGGGFYNAHAIPISIVYFNTGMPPHTVALLVKLKSRNWDYPDETVQVKLDFDLVSPIVEDGKPAYIPGL